MPRHDTRLYDYLKRSFAETRSVEVVLDRRQPSTTGPSSPVARDLRRPRTAGRRGLGGILIDNAAPCQPERPAPQHDRSDTEADRSQPAPPRRRLWPVLRFEDFTLVRPEADPERGEENP